MSTEHFGNIDPLVVVSFRSRIIKVGIANTASEKPACRKHRYEIRTCSLLITQFNPPVGMIAATQVRMTKFFLKHETERSCSAHRYSSLWFCSCPESFSSYQNCYLGRGCSAAEEYFPLDHEAAGLNPAGRSGFLYFPFRLLHHKK